MHIFIGVNGDHIKRSDYRPQDALTQPYELTMETEMYTEQTAHPESSYRRSEECCGRSGKWSFKEVAPMVLAFIFFFPLGLFLLFYKLCGFRIWDLPAHASELFGKARDMAESNRSSSEARNSGNTVFDSYQKGEFERAEQIRREIAERAKRFAEFREGERRRKDQSEFDRFSNDAPAGQ